MIAKALRPVPPTLKGEKEGVESVGEKGVARQMHEAVQDLLGPESLQGQAESDAPDKARPAPRRVRVGIDEG